jgi:hypothetical protein
MKNKFTGLDYMLLHNLYYALTPTLWMPLMNSMGDDAQNAVAVKLYPNPATHTMFVEVANNENKKLTLQIFNSVGVQVYASTMLNENRIDVSGFNSGLYFLLLNNEVRKTFVIE